MHIVATVFLLLACVAPSAHATTYTITTSNSTTSETTTVSIPTLYQAPLDDTIENLITALGGSNILTTIQETLTPLTTQVMNIMTQYEEGETFEEETLTTVSNKLQLLALQLQVHILQEQLASSTSTSSQSDNWFFNRLYNE